MQPWQAAGEATKKSAKLPFFQMAKAANLLTYAIPSGLAVQGLSKLNPTLKKFFDLASQFGFSQEEALNNLKEKQTESKQTKTKSLFERLLGDVDPASINEGMQKQLQFLMPIAQKLEEKGKDEKDPAVKKLREKIGKVLKGQVGFLQKQAMELDPNALPIQSQPQAPMSGQMGQSQQGGQGQEALLAILQKIQAMRGGGG